MLLRNKGRPVISIEKSRKLHKQIPMVDDNGLIRMVGCVKRAEFLPFDLQLSLILPDNQRITWLTVQHYNERSGHRYCQAVNNELRQLYHIPHVDAVIQRVSDCCVWCNMHRCRPESPRMATLPVRRLTPMIPGAIQRDTRTQNGEELDRAVYLHGNTRGAFGGSVLTGNEVVLVDSPGSNDCADQLTKAKAKWTFKPPGRTANGWLLRAVSTFGEGSAYSARWRKKNEGRDSTDSEH